MFDYSARAHLQIGNLIFQVSLKIVRMYCVSTEKLGLLRS